MPWHPFPLFLISSFPFWRAREMSRPVWLTPGWDTEQKLPTHFYVPTGLEVLCLPGQFVLPHEPFSGGWLCPLRMSLGQRTQIHDKVSTHVATQLKTGGWTEMRRGSPEKKENEPSPLGSASPLLWGRPALPPRGCAIRCKKKKKKETKTRSWWERKKVREEENQGGESREGSWGRRQGGEEGDVKKSSSISLWRAYNAPSSRFHIYYLFCLQ